MHSSSFHWQSLLCQTSQNPQQDRGKLSHTNFGAVESISDILSVTNSCFVNKTCMYKRPQNVLTRSAVTARDNSCHHAMSYQITAKRLFSTLLTPERWLQTNTVICRATPSARHFAPLVQKSSDFEDQIGKSFWTAGNGNCSVTAKANSAPAVRQKPKHRPTLRYRSSSWPPKISDRSQTSACCQCLWAQTWSSAQLG